MKIFRYNCWAVGLLLLLTGCVAWQPARLTAEQARQAAGANLGSVRSLELLQDVAQEQQERRRVARLDGLVADYAAKSDRFSIFNDPLLAELDFALLYAQILQLPQRTELSQAVLPLARRQLARQIDLLLCQLSAAPDADKEIIEAEILLLTGWTRKQLDRLNLSTLPPVPPPDFRSHPPVKSSEMVKTIRRLYYLPTPQTIEQAQKMRICHLQGRYASSPHPAVRRALLLELRRD